MAGSGDAPTLQTTTAFRPSGRRLLVFGEGTFSTHALPGAGDLVIGRSPTSDICVDQPSVSRRHLQLSLGSDVEVEDLGSSNGTRVRGAALGHGERASVAPGDVVEVGSVMLVVQASAAAARPRRLWSLAYFEGRLDEECARADQLGKPFAVALVSVPRGADTSAVEAALGAELGPTDLVALGSPGEYAILIIDSAVGRGDEMLEALAARLGARFGVAWYPKDGRSPDALLSRARVAASGGEDAYAARPVAVVDPAGAMQQLEALVERIAAGMISVLLLGETGVGKEVLAERIHERSPRARRAFMRINCAALTETLLESELFGHERGAFTGAVQTKIGLLEAGDGGTVFLDEVGELPPATQAKLLRVIEERTILRVGSVKERPIDVRFIAATNRDLEAEIRRGAFREDLYFRLNGISLVIPPLRDRRGEIERLARLFAREAARQSGDEREPEVSHAALAMLDRYPWPGNIRELRNVIERAVLLAGDGPIEPAHLPVEKMGATFLAPPSPGLTNRFASLPARQPLALSGPPTLRPQAPPIPPPSPPEPTLPGDAHDAEPAAAKTLAQEMADLERRRILEALERCGGNQSRAAELLGLPRRTLVARLGAYGITRPRKR